MFDRCYREANVEYHRYGGQGVTVCAEWRDLARFIADMGVRPEGMTIDRYPNRDGNYEPTNCRWATPHTQALTRRTTKLTEDLVQEIHGRHEHGEPNWSIAQRMGVARCTISQIIGGTKWKGSVNGYRKEA